MKQKRCLLTVASLIAGLGLVAWLALASSAQGDPAAPAVDWTRSLEPVVLDGSQLRLFYGAALDDLFVYAYDGLVWQAIPFQIDEVSASGTYTVEDGLFDTNDELVFMAMDLGEEADPADWIADADAQAHPRYRVQVSNPLADPVEEGWVYVYRSTTLVPGPVGDYVDWDANASRVVAATYVLGFDTATHFGIDSLELNNNGTDLLDRSKLRINATCRIGGFPVWTDTLDEEDLAGLFEVTPDVDGPVRVGWGGAQGSWWFYPSLFESHTLMSLDGLGFEPCTSIDVNWLRVSNDWRDPAETGMAPATYYDSNTPAGVPLDGSPDTVSSTPLVAWQQASGAQGSTVQIVDIALDSGLLSNYYKDNGAIDLADTGDGKSFGDAGFYAAAPSGQASIRIMNFVLDPNQPNVGDTYRGFYASPLQISTGVEGDVRLVYLPLVLQAYP